MRRLRKIRIGWMICLATVAVGTSGLDHALGQTPESLIKSAILYNLTKVVTWPPAAQVHGGSFLLGVIGEDDSDPDFASITGKPVGSVPLELKRGSDPSQMRDCSLVYVSLSESDRCEEILAGLEDSHALTVSEIDDFAIHGGVIQIIHRGSRFGFLINTLAAEDSELRLSSQLLKMAEILDEEPR